MSARLEVDTDAYGKYARLSAVADWVERLALEGIRLSEADLADYIDDSDWRFPLHWDAGAGGAIEEEDSDEIGASRRDARSVFGVLEEREELLRDHYPFRFADGRFECLGTVESRECPYVVLLAVTLTHAYGLCDLPIPAQVFEGIVAGCLTSERLKVVDFGKLRRTSTSFPEALSRAGSILDLPVDAAGAVRSRMAQDEACDTLGHLSWGDKRPGLWSFVGQVTCGKSESWESKLMEPKHPRWTGWLGTGVSPTMFLALPHHVEAQHMSRLAQVGDRVVLDRIRLARFKSAISEDEKALVEAMLGAECDVPWSA